MKINHFLLFMLLGLWLQAQSPYLETISIEQGLSQGFVPSICQDEEGFLWFATKNGLNRYDGYHFKVFRNDPFDPLSLNNNEVCGIVASGDFIIVFTRHRDLMLFHRKTQRFFTIHNPLTGPSEVSTGFMNRGKSSLLSFGIDGLQYTTYQIQWPEDLSERILSNPDIKSVQQFFTITRLFRANDELGCGLSADGTRCWRLTKKKMTVHDLIAGKETEIPLPPLTFRDPGAIIRCNIIPEISGITWVRFEDQLAGWNGHQWVLHRLSAWSVGFLQFDRKTGLLWLCQDKKVYAYNLLSKPFLPYPVWDLDFGKPIISGFSDQSGLLWFGTDALGVVKFSPRTGSFKNYLNGMSVYCQPVHNGRQHVLLSDVRHSNGGRMILDLSTGLARNLADAGVVHLPENNIPATENGYFWWVSWDKAKKGAILVRYQPETGMQESFMIPGDVSTAYAALKIAEPGQVWIITTQKLLKYDIGNHRFTTWEINKNQAAEVYAAERSRSGTWWIGTMDGLIKAEPSSGGIFSFTVLRAEFNNRNSLPGNCVKSLLADPSNPDLLWIGTNGMGMSRLEISKMKFTHFNLSGGVIPDDVVYGILPEVKSGARLSVKLWISTNRGLTRFDPGTGFSQFFGKADGLQDNEFNTYASFRSSTGELLFGGVNGLTVFNPENLSINSLPPVLQFTGLSVNGRVVNALDSAGILKKDISFQQELRLSYGQNNLELQFAAMDFNAPEQNHFVYFLEGAEPKWLHHGFDHSAQYLNLSPGTYTFKVKAASSNGVLNDRPISLKVIIRAPWYLTWPAFLVYLVTFILAGYLFNQYQLIQRLKAAEAKRLKNLDQFKTRFYTNITHEFRTPLTVILGITQQLMNEYEAALHPLTLVKRNGENLLRLINQILDLAKLESHDLKINYVQGNVLAYLRYIAESLHSLANVQNVMLKIESSPSEIIMDYDPERMLQTIHNLLSNAIKFTPSGGKVTLMARQEGYNLIITVTDTGIGVKPEELPYIFDRFFQARIQETMADAASRRPVMGSGGTGIGLSLTRELVQAMGGEISVASPVPGSGKGTVFKLTLPVTNIAPPTENETSGSTDQAESCDHFNAPTIPESASCILLIEDNPDVMEYLAACLGNQYRLEYAFNGHAGIEKALEFIPDLVISDVMMPQKDGFEVCDFLKNNECTSHIPIILLTARVTMEDRISGLRRGADAYLSKPFHEEELLVWVEQLISRQRLMQARYANLAPVITEASQASPPDNFSAEDAFVIKLKSIIDANYTDPDVTVEAIAAGMGMSRSQLYRKLSSLTGRSVTEHINNLRLERSRELLKSSGLTISEVAYQVGFNDPKYFGRLFSEAFGISPSEYSSKH